MALDKFLSAGRLQRNHYNQMENNDAGSSNNVPLHGGVGPSTPPPMPYMGEVSKRIYQLQLQLADRTLQLGRVTAKYDRLLVQEANSIKEVAQLRALIDNQH